VNVIAQRQIFVALVELRFVFHRRI
jgi:hypothetical protein